MNQSVNRAPLSREVRLRLSLSLSLLVMSAGWLTPGCMSGPEDDAPELATSEVNALGNNIRFFGYYQADQLHELEVVAGHSTTLIMEGEINDERFSQMRQRGVKVFLSLASVFFAWDAACPCNVFQDADADTRWASVRDVILRNRDVIEAFIPIDEPEFSRFPGTDDAQPMRRRDGLERIATLVRRDIPGAKMAVNFWGDTVRQFARDAFEFQRRYPPSYDYVGTESYEASFDESLYRSLLSLTASVKTPAPEVYLVPKAFLNVGNDRFPQPDGESGIVTRHLDRAMAFANGEPRVVGLFAFLYRTIGEAGGQLTGVNEHPAIQGWMRRNGEAIRNGSSGGGGGSSGGSTTTGRVRLWRLWNEVVRDHFYTTSEVEANQAVANHGYRMEAELIYIHAQPGDGRVPLYRYFGNQGSDHFYTTRGGGAPLVAGDYRLEGIAGHVYPTAGSDRVRLYRYWSPSGTDHFYTTRHGGASTIPATDYRLEDEEIWVFESSGGSGTSSGTTGTTSPSSPTSSWRMVSGRLKNVSVGADGAVWGVNASDQIYQRVGEAWRNIPGGLKQITVGSAAHVWGVNANDHVYRRDQDRWTRIPGSLKHVSVGADGAVWGVNASNQIFRRVGDSWQNIPGSLKQISVGSAGHVWGVNSANQIYQRVGASWARIPGSLKHVSVGADGAVWGVNASDQIFRRVGSDWEHVGGALKQIDVGGANLVWGVNAGDLIYRRVL
ncbi:MAG: hypothetical protein IPK13_18595 [Deltaproteobacteria bacterium]|nr:hypothetical protein [Deltaproteobacteria bacterium]